MLNRLIRTLMTRRKVALGLLALVTVGFAVPAAQVKPDNSVDVWFLDNDPSLASYKAFQATFGNDEVVAIAVVHPSSVWQPKVLNALWDVTQALEDIDGVARVMGITRAKLTAISRQDQEEVLDVAPAMTGPVDAAAVAQLRARIEADAVLNDRLVVANGRVALLFVQMATNADIDSVRPKILEQVEAAVAPLKTAGLEHHTGGIGVIYNALNLIAQKEGGIFMGAAFLVIFLLLWPLFRSLAAVLASVGAVSCAVVITRGVYGLAGKDENMVTMTLPVLILILGVADCIHIFRYRASRPNDDPVDVLTDIIRPCLFTTLTTMVGFGALATSRMAVVKDLGIFAALGIGAAFVCSVVFATFVMGRPSFAVKRPSEPGEGLSGHLLAWSARFAIKNKEVILGVTALLILLFAAGIAKIQVDTYSIGFLSDSSVVRQDSDAIEKRVGPFTPLELVVDAGPGEESIKNPAVLRGMFAAERALARRSDVRDAFSLADIIARLHQVNGGEGTPYEVPNDAFMVADDLEIYASDPDGQLDQLVDPARQKARLTVSVPVLSARGYKQLIEKVTAEVQSHLPAGATVKASGYLPLYVKMMDYVVASQVSSFGIAFFVVFLLIGILFGSVRMAGLAVLPNVFPVFITLGTMGYLSINLDVATVTIASIIIGIVVDDTIHYLHRYRAELRRADGDHERAAHATALASGRAIGATSIIFTVGLLILGFASVKSIAFFGLLTALAMVVALIGDLLVLPAVLVALRPKL